MKKTTVNVKTLMKLANTMENDTLEIKIGVLDGRDIVINVRKTISLEDFYTVCGALTMTPFATGDDGSAMYVPSAELSAFRIAIIKAFTDIELPENVGDTFMLVCRLGLFEKVHNVLKDTDMYSALQVIAERFSDYHRISNTGLSAIEKSLSSINLSEAIEKAFSEFASIKESAVTED